jgi:hypothetical protein
MQRGLSTKEAAAYCGLSVAGFRAWRKRGIAPGPIKGTYRYDLTALNLAIDRASGLAKAPETQANSYDKWKASQNESHPRPHKYRYKKSA